jgi:hypothetical protein
MKLQKRYLEVSRSTREEVRAFFHFTDKRKNYEILQTSQKTRVKILRCVKGVEKLFSKKRNLLFFYKPRILRWLAAVLPPLHRRFTAQLILFLSFSIL